jgi:hypothetical protein
MGADVVYSVRNLFGSERLYHHSPKLIKNQRPFGGALATQPEVRESAGDFFRDRWILGEFHCPADFKLEDPPIAQHLQRRGALGICAAVGGHDERQHPAAYFLSHEGPLVEIR